MSRKKRIYCRMEKKYIKIGNRLKILRGKKTQTEFANDIGTTLRTYQHYESGGRQPAPDTLKVISDKYGKSVDWILKGPNETSYPENHNSLNTFKISEDMQKTYPASSAPGSNNSGIEPSLQAMSDIKEIFDSGDPILIPAIQANLNAFKRALLRERQFAQVIDENKDLRSRIVKLENLCKSLQSKVNCLTATYEDTEGDSKDCSNHDTKK